MVRALRPLMISPEKGAQTSMYLASSLEVEGVSGRYFVKRAEARSSDLSYDEGEARRLWEVSAELTNLPAQNLQGRRNNVARGIEFCLRAAQLEHDVTKLATATLIARHLPDHRKQGGGGRLDYALAQAGYTLRNNRLDWRTVLEVLLAAWDTKGDGPQRRTAPCPAAQQDAHSFCCAGSRRPPRFGDDTTRQAIG
jgi:hypothetical protein